MQPPIRSFVLRQGRFSVAQKRALEEGMPHWGIEYCSQRLDLDAAFGRHAPRILEIGFGMGEATAQIAANNPDKDYLAVEVHSPGIGNLLKLIFSHRLTNIRIIRHDAVEVIDSMLAESQLDGIHLFFPDPWPKKRHHKRRLVRPILLEKLTNKLKPHGYLHVATDWEEYAHQILSCCCSNTILENTVQHGFAPRPDYRPVTKFEQRGLKQGHYVWDIIFRRRQSISPVVV